MGDTTIMASVPDGSAELRIAESPVVPPVQTGTNTMDPPPAINVHREDAESPVQVQPASNPAQNAEGSLRGSSGSVSRTLRYDSTTGSESRRVLPEEAIPIHFEVPSTNPAISLTTIESNELMDNMDPCPGCTIPVRIYISTLLMHHDPDIGLRQGQIQCRFRNGASVTKLQVEQQLTQFLLKPREALDGIPTSFVAHSIQRLCVADNDAQRARLLPAKLGNDNTDLYMSHIQLVHARELMARITWEGAPKQPLCLDDNNALHVVAWCLYLMSISDAVTLFLKMQAWYLEIYKDNNKNEANTRQEVEKWPFAQWYKLLGSYFTSCTPIRLSSLLGDIRNKTIIYVMSDDPSAIGLESHLWTYAQRIRVRNLIFRNPHGTQLFNTPQCVWRWIPKPGGGTVPVPLLEKVPVFSNKEVTLLQHIATDKQINLENAKPLWLADKLLSHSTTRGEFGIKLPWQSKLFKRNEFVYSLFCKSVTFFFRKSAGFNMENYLQRNTYKGIKGTVLTGVRSLHTYRCLRLETTDERQQYIVNEIPISFRKTFLDSLKQQYPDWMTQPGRWVNKYDTVQATCYNIAAYYGVIFGEAFQHGDGIEHDLRRWLASSNAFENGDGMLERKERLNLIHWLIERYYHPVQSVLDAIQEKEKSTEQERRCHWRIFVMEVALCVQIGGLYGKNDGMIKIGNTSVTVPAFFDILARLVLEGYVVVSASVLNKPSPLPTMEGALPYYPGVALSSFHPRFAFKGSENWRTVEQIIMLCDPDNQVSDDRNGHTPRVTTVSNRDGEEDSGASDSEDDEGSDASNSKSENWASFILNFKNKTINTLDGNDGIDDNDEDDDDFGGGGGDNNHSGSDDDDDDDDDDDEDPAGDGQKTGSGAADGDGGDGTKKKAPKDKKGGGGRKRPAKDKDPNARRRKKINNLAKAIGALTQKELAEVRPSLRKKTTKNIAKSLRQLAK